MLKVTIRFYVENAQLERVTKSLQETMQLLPETKIHSEWREGGQFFIVEGEFAVAALSVLLGGLSMAQVVGLNSGPDISWGDGEVSRVLAPSEREALGLPLSEVGGSHLSVRTQNALRNDEIYHLGTLAKWTERELLRIPHIGRKGISEIKQLLFSHKLEVGMDVGDWVPPKSG